MLSTNATLSTSPGPDRFFSTLRWCTFSSFVLLVLATVMRMPPWVAMSVGALPLVWYHLGYLTPRAKKGLSQTAIDSVYYFGFLVTIAALGVSAVSLAVSGGKEPLNNIAFQFGLGLFATGYAVIARMHLSSVTTLVDDASPEAVLDRYVQRSRELVTNVELASTQFVQLSNNLMAKSQEVAETARLATERSMLEVARVFDEQLRGTLASARQGLTEIRGLVNETSFVQEREELVRSVKMTLETVNQLNRALSELAQRSEEGARTSEAAIAASSALNSTLTTFRENLERIGGSEGQMVTSAKTLAQAQTVVAESTDALSGVMKELSEMTGTVSGIGLTFKSIKTLTQKANEQMEALTNSSKRLDGATQNIAKSANATGLLAANLDRTAAALPLLAEQSVALERRLGNLGEVVGAVEQQLQALPRPTEEVINISADLKSALASVQQLLACASTEAKSLAGHTLTTAEALEKANRLSHDVAALQNTTESANRILTDLAATVEKLHISLNDSTGSLKSALATATQSLESDVKRSSDAARLFGERLTNVAQIIIDRTKEERPA